MGWCASLGLFIYWVASSGDPTILVASSLFAIAGAISDVARKIDKDNKDKT